MPTDRAKRTIAEILRYTWVVEHRSLHDSGRENYLIPGGIVIGLSRISLIFLCQLIFH